MMKKARKKNAALLVAVAATTLATACSKDEVKTTTKTTTTKKVTPKSSSSTGYATPSSTYSSEATSKPATGATSKLTVGGAVPTEPPTVMAPIPNNASASKPATIPTGPSKTPTSTPEPSTTVKPAPKVITPAKTVAPQKAATPSKPAPDSDALAKSWGSKVETELKKSSFTGKVSIAGRDLTGTGVVAWTVKAPTKVQAQVETLAVLKAVKSVNDPHLKGIVLNAYVGPSKALVAGYWKEALASLNLNSTSASKIWDYSDQKLLNVNLLLK